MLGLEGRHVPGTADDRDRPARGLARLGDLQAHMRFPRRLEGIGRRAVFAQRAHGIRNRSKNGTRRRILLDHVAPPALPVLVAGSVRQDTDGVVSDALQAIGRGVPFASDPVGAGIAPVFGFGPGRPVARPLSGHPPPGRQVDEANRHLVTDRPAHSLVFG